MDAAAIGLLVNVHSLLPADEGTREWTGGNGRSNALAGRDRTCIGHQNQRPNRAAMEGVMNERTTKVSNSRPRPTVVPT